MMLRNDYRFFRDNLDCGCAFQVEWYYEETDCVEGVMLILCVAAKRYNVYENCVVYWACLFVCVVLAGAGREENTGFDWDFCWVRASCGWCLLVVSEWWSHVSLDHASSQGYTAFLACDFHHHGQWCVSRPILNDCLLWFKSHFNFAWTCYWEYLRESYY